MAKKPKNLTLAHIEKNSTCIRAVNNMPSIAPPKGRIWIQALTHNHEDYPYEPAILHHFLNTSRRFETQIFCDANFFIGKTDPELWKYVLEKKGRLQIVPEIAGELKFWLNDNNGNNGEIKKYVQDAVEGKESPVSIWELPNKEYIPTSYLYYIQCLALREILPGPLAQFKYPNKIKSQQMEAVVKELGPRVHSIAKKAPSPEVVSERFTIEKDGPKRIYPDGALVVAAIYNAVVNGIETCILTHDKDVFEQFYKATTLIECHYYSMLFGEAYSEDPKEFNILKCDNLKLDCMEDNFIALKQHANTVRDLLFNTHNVICYCIYIDPNYNVFQSFTYCAVREWEKLFKVKANTKGLSSDCLNGRNCHIEIGGYQKFFRKHHNHPILIGKDRVLPLDQPAFNISMIDLELLLHDFEHCNKIEFTVRSKK